MSEQYAYQGVDHSADLRVEPTTRRHFVDIIQNRTEQSVALELDPIVKALRDNDRIEKVADALADLYGINQDEDRYTDFHKGRRSAYYVLSIQARAKGMPIPKISPTTMNTYVTHKRLAIRRDPYHLKDAMRKIQDTDKEFVEALDQYADTPFLTPRHEGSFMMGAVLTWELINLQILIDDEVANTKLTTDHLGSSEDIIDPNNVDGFSIEDETEFIRPLVELQSGYRRAQREEQPEQQFKK